ncbi:MAG: endonuclease/exonuclease/phosphatase family protein, partial [Limisphaerales bacterium]
MIRKESEPDNNTQTGKRPWRRRCAHALSITCVGYVLFLLVFLFFVRWTGERFWLSSLILLLPAQIWLIPLFLLLPLALLFQRRSVWVLIVGAAVVMLGYLDFRWSIERAPTSGPTLSILSNNIGQRKTRTMWPFLRAEAPDIFAHQEAPNHKPAISSENPGYYVAAHGEFLLASRFEILDSGFVPHLRARTGPVAAWFEIDFHGTPIVIYNVHMPTPRNEVNKLRGAGFLFELARFGGIYSREARATYKQSLEFRRQLAMDLLAHLRNEKRPFIVVGDFNMAETGYLRRLYAAELNDAFAERGKGYGHTFPGMSRNPLTLFGPWLRIDYIFTGPGWKTLSYRTEPRQPAQHL